MYGDAHEQIFHHCVVYTLSLVAIVSGWFTLVILVSQWKGRRGK